MFARYAFLNISILLLKNINVILEYRYIHQKKTTMSEIDEDFSTTVIQYWLSTVIIASPRIRSGRSVLSQPSQLKLRTKLYESPEPTPPLPGRTGPLDSTQPH